MTRSKSSGRWLKEHFADPYVKRAQQEGYRSRAVFKLLEICERDKLFRRGMTVLDLGAAPGGWSQIAAEKVGKEGKVIAVDILPMTALRDVVFIQGDFREENIMGEVNAALEGRAVDVILSDMAPNSSGITAIDQPRAMYLAEICLTFGQEVLAKGGSLLVKIFQGEGYEGYVKALRTCFQQVVVRKPDASRARSREIYLLGKRYMV